MQGVWGYAPPENMCALRLFVVASRLTKRLEITELKNSWEGEGGRGEREIPPPVPCHPLIVMWGRFHEYYIIHCPKGVTRAQDW